MAENPNQSICTSPELPFPAAIRPEERWAPALGFEGLYEVSNLGQVRSIARSIKRSDGRVNRILGQILHPGSRPSGHLHVTLRKGGGYYTRTIHRLVLEAFVGPAPDGHQCCHNNGDPKDNRLCNIRWDTPKANSADSKRHGTGNQGFRNPNSRLTPEQIVSIRNSSGTNADVAAAFGVSQETVRRIRKGLRWADVEAA